MQLACSATNVDRDTDPDVDREGTPSAAPKKQSFERARLQAAP
jgi:hypothetical protein